MAEKSTVLTYKGHPLRRKDNLIYYGSMADKNNYNNKKKTTHK